MYETFQTNFRVKEWNRKYRSFSFWFKFLISMLPPPIPGVSTGVFKDEKLKDQLVKTIREEKI
jgi:hypothetical protein